MKDQPARPETTRQLLCPKRDFKIACETPMVCAAQCKYADDPVHPNRVEAPTTTILPQQHEPVPYEDVKRALNQISAALKPYGLILVTNILDGSFSVEKDHPHRSAVKSAGVQKYSDAACSMQS
jgi:hypothetical protein